VAAAPETPSPPSAPSPAFCPRNFPKQFASVRGLGAVFLAILVFFALVGVHLLYAPFVFVQLQGGPSWAPAIFDAGPLVLAALALLSLRIPPHEFGVTADGLVAWRETRRGPRAQLYPWTCVRVTPSRVPGRRTVIVRARAPGSRRELRLVVEPDLPLPGLGPRSA
jgi:hypothetical protein